MFDILLLIHSLLKNEQIIVRYNPTINKSNNYFRSISSYQFSLSLINFPLFIMLFFITSYSTFNVTAVLYNATDF